MNTLHITDMHIQMLPSFNDMLESKRIQEFFKRLEYWLHIKDTHTKNNFNNTINIYLWGDMFNYLSFSNIDSCIISWYWHLFLIKKFLEEKNLILKNVYYILWNHEFYVDRRWSEKRNQLYFSENLDEDNQIDNTLYNVCYEKEFAQLLTKLDFKKEKFERQSMFARTIRNNFSVSDELANIFSYSAFQKFDVSDRNNLVHTLITRWIHDVLWKEAIDLSLWYQYDSDSKTWIIWNILCAPYKGSFNEKITEKELKWLMCINDIYFFAELFDLETFIKECQFVFDLSYLELNSFYQRYLEIYSETVSLLLQYKELWKPKLWSVFQKTVYCITQCYFYKNYLQLINDCIQVLRQKKYENIETLDILIHFPFDVFDKEFEERSWCIHTITEENLDSINFYKQSDTNTYFNVHNSFLEELMRIIYENSNTLKTVNIYAWHTHINHRTTWNYCSTITYNVINSSFDYFK